uniref:Uncharacterized protein n=1 Tax=Anopheles atroparvus TaxID=41427 RepID=A0AAG5DRR1_ANOAO
MQRKATPDYHNFRSKLRRQVIPDASSETQHCNENTAGPSNASHPATAEKPYDVIEVGDTEVDQVDDDQYNLSDAKYIETDSSDEDISPYRNYLESNASFREKLRYWAHSFSIPHSALNVLLFILNNNQVSQLPKDSRTILQTNRTPVQTVAIGTGQFWYNGIKKCLMQHFRNTVPRVDNISLNVSIYRLPLHRSSSSQFWPILINIHEMPEVPVLKVAIFSGTSKPDDLELYLRPFVSELNELQDHGITLNRKRLKVRIRVVIAVW